MIRKLTLREWDAYAEFVPIETMAHRERAFIERAERREDLRTDEGDVEAWDNANEGYVR